MAVRGTVALAALCLLATLTALRSSLLLLRPQSFVRKGAAQGPDTGTHPLLFFSALLGRKCGNDTTCTARERNAVASWALLAGDVAPGGFCILALFEQEARYDPVVCATPHTKCVALPHCADAATGVLTVDCMAREALARGAQLLGVPQFSAVLVNSDVIFTQSLTHTLIVARAEFGQQFVLVGRRLDAPVTEMIADGTPPERMVRDALEIMRTHGEKHSVFGFDYFVFPALSFPRSFPPFLVGRYRWDNVLALELLASGLPFVDATESVVCIHQGYVVNASRPNHIGRFGAATNAKLARAHSGDAHLLGRMDNADWRVEGSCPQCRIVQQQPKSGWLLSAYKFAHPQSRALLVLHAKSLREVRDAALWAAWLSERKFTNAVAWTCTGDVRDALLQLGMQAELLTDGCGDFLSRLHEAVPRMLRSNISPVMVFAGVAAAPESLQDALSIIRNKIDAVVRLFGGGEEQHALAVQLAPTLAAKEAWKGIKACLASSGTRPERACIARACISAEGSC